MIKRLARSVREYKKEVILSPLFVALEVVMEVAIPFLIAKLIDDGIDAGNMDNILRIGGLLALCALGSLIFGVLAGRFAAIASAGYARTLRRDLYYHAQEFSFANIDRFSTSSLVTRMTTDVTNVQNAFQMIIRVAVRSPLMLTFALIMAFRENATLSWIFVFFIPLLAGGMYTMIHFAHPVFERVFQTYDKLNNVVRENLYGIRVVKSYVREKHEVNKFGDVSNVIFKDFRKAERIVSFGAPLMQFSMYACTLLLSWFGAKLIVGGTGMTTGSLTSLLSYSMQILISLMMLSMVMVMMTISRASAERIVEVLDENPDLSNGPNPVMEVKDGSISFRDVGFSYAKDPDKLCLMNVNLDIRSGETVGILGGTGSAKTSLVQLIPRLFDVTTGALLVGGVDVRDYDVETLRSEVAMVLQKNVLFSGTIKENLRWGNEHATDEELIHACQLAQADDFVKGFADGYDTHIEQGGTNVSGGQKQRLCIARALLKKPKILILDDSTSAVDTKTDALIRRAFRDEIPNTTKIIIAQRVSSVEDADKIIVMEGGRVDAVGTHEELLASNAIYREVAESQKKGGSLHE